MPKHSIAKGDAGRARPKRRNVGRFDARGGGGRDPLGARGGGRDPLGAAAAVATEPPSRAAAADDDAAAVAVAARAEVVPARSVATESPLRVAAADDDAAAVATEPSPRRERSSRARRAPTVFDNSWEAPTASVRVPRVFDDDMDCVLGSLILECRLDGSDEPLRAADWDSFKPRIDWEQAEMRWQQEYPHLRRKQVKNHWHGSGLLARYKSSRGTSFLRPRDGDEPIERTSDSNACDRCGRVDAHLSVVRVHIHSEADAGHALVCFECGEALGNCAVYLPKIGSSSASAITPHILVVDRLRAVFVRWRMLIDRHRNARGIFDIRRRLKAAEGWARFDRMTNLDALQTFACSVCERGVMHNELYPHTISACTLSNRLCEPAPDVLEHIIVPRDNMRPITQFAGLQLTYLGIQNYDEAPLRGRAGVSPALHCQCADNVLDGVRARRADVSSSAFRTAADVDEHDTAERRRMVHERALHFAHLRLCISCAQSLALNSTTRVPKLPRFALANGLNCGLMYLRSYQKLVHVDALIAEVQRWLAPSESHQLADISEVAERLVAVLHLRRFVMRLGAGPLEERQTGVLNHMMCLGRDVAHAKRLVDVEKLPERWKIVFLGPVKHVEQLRAAVRQRMIETPNLPVVQRDEIRGVISHYRRFSMVPGLTSAQASVLLQDAGLDERIDQLPDDPDIPAPLVAAATIPDDEDEAAVFAATCETRLHDYNARQIYGSDDLLDVSSGRASVNTSNVVAKIGDAANQIVLLQVDAGDDRFVLTTRERVASLADVLVLRNRRTVKEVLRCNGCDALLAYGVDAFFTHCQTIEHNDDFKFTCRLVTNGDGIDRSVETTTSSMYEWNNAVHSFDGEKRAIVMRALQHVFVVRRQLIGEAYRLRRAAQYESEDANLHAVAGLLPLRVIAVLHSFGDVNDRLFQLLGFRDVCACAIASKGLAAAIAAARKRHALGGVSVHATGTVESGTDIATGAHRSAAALSSGFHDTFAPRFAGDDSIMASCHDGIIENEFANPRAWEGTFPMKFVSGVGGPENDPTTRPDRPVALSLDMWVVWALSNVTQIFARCPNALFLMNCMRMRREILRSSRWLIKSPFDGDELESIIAAFHADEEKHATRDQKLLCAKMKNQVRIAGSRVRGSPMQRRGLRDAIGGLVMRFGVTWVFFTLNIADVHDLRCTKMCDGALEIKLDAPIPRSARARLVAANPVAAARYFDLIARAFFEALLNFPHKNGKPTGTGLFGTMRGYIMPIETQERATLHGHLMAAVLEVVVALLEEQMRDDEHRARMLAFVDEVVDAFVDDTVFEVPSAQQPDIPSAHQRHLH